MVKIKSLVTLLTFTLVTVLGSSSLMAQNVPVNGVRNPQVAPRPMNRNLIHTPPNAQGTQRVRHNQANGRAVTVPPRASTTNAPHADR
jgi:hypothetical protein